VDIETLKEIKDLATAALSGRQKLEKINAAHIKAINEGTTRARSTTYHATAANIMTDTVEPSERRLKEIIGSRESENF
jgi:hypothetical protein